jgi:hypothetical protein
MGRVSGRPASRDLGGGCGRWKVDLPRLTWRRNAGRISSTGTETVMDRVFVCESGRLAAERDTSGDGPSMTCSTTTARPDPSAREDIDSDGKVDVRTATAAGVSPRRNRDRFSVRIGRARVRMQTGARPRSQSPGSPAPPARALVIDPRRGDSSRRRPGLGPSAGVSAASAIYLGNGGCDPITSAPNRDLQRHRWTIRARCCVSESDGTQRDLLVFTHRGAPALQA